MFDKIVVDSTIIFEGKAYDYTGIVDSVWIKINADTLIASMQTSHVPNEFPFLLEYTLDKPISNIYVWAKDSVPFCPPPLPDTISKHSDVPADSTRINYVFFDTDTAFLKKDMICRMYAHPPGGVFTMDFGEIDSSGIFNPGKIKAGNHTVNYKYTTPSFPQGEKISQTITITSVAQIQGNEEVCKNAYQNYSYEIAESSGWSVKGGVITTYDLTDNSVEVQWKDQPSGWLQGYFLDNGNQDSSSKILIAVNNNYAPDKPKIFRQDKLFFSSIDDASCYQWKKNGIPVNKPEAQKAYFYDEDYNPADSVYYSVMVSNCDDCLNCRCWSESYRLLNTATDCEGCTSQQQVYVETEAGFTAQADIAIVNLLMINNRNRIELSITDKAVNRVYTLVMQSEEEITQYSLWLKGLIPERDYEIKIND